MKRRRGTGALVCVLVGCGNSGVVPDPSSPETSAGADGSLELFADDTDPAMAALPFVEDELLVQPYPGADAQALHTLYQRIGALEVEDLDEIQLAILEVADGSLDTCAERLAESGLIEAIHKNYVLEAQVLPDDPDVGRQNHLVQVGAPQAWDRTVGADTVLVAVVDTGVQPDHPDLVGRIAGGWNVYDDNDDYSDPVGHGTQVAGVVAATTNNGVGVAGITWENPVLVVRAGGPTGQTTSRHVAAGILWASGQGARVINVSFAPLWSNSVVRSAARQAYNRGALVVISAGNRGGMATVGGYDEALFVGAVDHANTIATFSDRGPFIDLVAPGTSIRSTALGNGYRLANGTSFAAPIVTGVAALAWSMNPDLRPVSIVEAVTGSATDLGAAGPDDTYGQGAVDASVAVGLAAEASFVPDALPPSLSVRWPRDGAVAAHRFVASVTATDRWGVADVVMSVDATPLATDTQSPYYFVVDPGGFDPGAHELSFVATDLAGNASIPQTVSVVFTDPRTGSQGEAGTVRFLSPAPGTLVSGDVHISATVAAEAGLATIEWRVDGMSRHAAALGGVSSGVSYLWRASEVPAGSHTVTIIITDASGTQSSGSLELVTH